METETWRRAVGFPDYEVSDLGRVRSNDRMVYGYFKPGRILKVGERRHKGRLNHISVRLGRGKSLRVHRLVLEAFVGPCPPGHEGCHNDGDPTNNRLSNLRWDTRSGNMQDAIRHGTHWTPFKNLRGEANSRTHLTADDIKTIRATPQNWRGAQAALARRFGVSGVTIKRIVERRVWSHV